MHLEVPIIATWLNEIAQVEHNAFVTAFLRKRDEVVNNLYRQNRDAAPSSADLLGDAIPLPVEKRRGKDMLKSIRRILAASNDPEHKKINLLVPGPKLRSAILQGYALVM